MLLREPVVDLGGSHLGRSKRGEGASCRLQSCRAGRLPDARPRPPVTPRPWPSQELELVEDVWRGEAQDLLSQIAQLQEENKQLMTNLSHKDVSFSEEEFQKHEGRRRGRPGWMGVGVGGLGGAGGGCSCAHDGGRSQSQSLSDPDADPPKPFLPWPRSLPERLPQRRFRHLAFLGVRIGGEGAAARGPVLLRGDKHVDR